MARISGCELDFLYPGEGIHKRWDNGYRITSTAATSDQVALILSMPRHKLTGDGQETLCTTLFPALHIKGKWIKNLYLARVCYGHVYLDYVFLDRCSLQKTIPVSWVFRLVLFHQYGG